MPTVLLTWEAIVGCSVARNHLEILQCDYQVINVEAISAGHKTMHMFMSHSLYTGGPQ